MVKYYGELVRTCCDTYCVQVERLKSNRWTVERKYPINGNDNAYYDAAEFAHKLSLVVNSGKVGSH